MTILSVKQGARSEERGARSEGGFGIQDSRTGMMRSWEPFAPVTPNTTETDRAQPHQPGSKS